MNKSKLKIQKALLRLMEKKDFGEIQVVELVEYAGVARATFYLHYKSREEVLLNFIDEMFDKFFNHAEVAFEHPEQLNETVATQMFEVFAAEPALSMAFTQPSAQTILLGRFRGYLARIIGRVIQQSNVQIIPQDQLGYIIDYWAGGSLQIIARWVAEDFQPEAEKMGVLYSKLTISGMKELLFMPESENK